MKNSDETALAPKQLSLGALASQQRHVGGTLQAGDLDRLAAVVNEVGPIRVEADFSSTRLTLAATAPGSSGTAAAKRCPRAKGGVTGQLQLNCQRCDLPVELELDVSFDLLLVNEATAELLPLETDVRIVQDGQVTLAELVEDELLLALPAQVCAQQECEHQPRLDYPAQGAAEGQDATAAGTNKRGVDDTQTRELQDELKGGKQWKNGADKPFAGLATLKGKLDVNPDG